MTHDKPMSIDETFRNNYTGLSFHVSDDDVKDIVEDGGETGYLVFYQPNGSEAVYAGKIPVEKAQEYDPNNLIHGILLLYAHGSEDTKLVKYSRASQPQDVPRIFMESCQMQEVDATIYPAFAYLQDDELHLFTIENRDGISELKEMKPNHRDPVLQPEYQSRLDEIIDDLSLTHSKTMQYR